MYTVQELKDELAKITGDAIKNLGKLGTDEYTHRAQYRDGVRYPATTWESYHKNGVEVVDIFWKNKEIKLQFKFGCSREELENKTLHVTTEMLNGWNSRIEETVKACVMMYDHVIDEVYKDQPK